MVAADWNEEKGNDIKEIQTTKYQVPFKYNEAAILKEFADYVAGTYDGHYIGEDNIQSLDLIFASGHGIGFATGNILKLGARYGKKEGYNRKDLLKIAHYALLNIYLLD